MRRTGVKEREASIQGTVIRELIARFTSDHLIGKKIKNGELRKKLMEPPWIPPQGFHVTEINLENFTMEWLSWGKINPKKVILQLHGGGYVGKMRNAYRNFAAAYCELGHGICVLTIDYRVAPEEPYPAALEDAFEAYQWLLKEGYESSQIILAGDSAGGGLALALTIYLKDTGISRFGKTWSKGPLHRTLYPAALRFPYCLQNRFGGSLCLRGICGETCT